MWVSDKLKEKIGLIVSACVYCACMCVCVCVCVCVCIWFLNFRAFVHLLITNCTSFRVSLLACGVSPCVGLVVGQVDAVNPDLLKFQPKTMATKGSARYAPLDIAGQVVLVTGASAGIGAATATIFAELGCKVKPSEAKRAVQCVYDFLSL